MTPEHCLQAKGMWQTLKNAVSDSMSAWFSESWLAQISTKKPRSLALTQRAKTRWSKSPEKSPTENPKSSKKRLSSTHKTRQMALGQKYRVPNKNLLLKGKIDPATCGPCRGILFDPWPPWPESFQNLRFAPRLPKRKSRWYLWRHMRCDMLAGEPGGSGTAEDLG